MPSEKVALPQMQDFGEKLAKRFFAPGFLAGFQGELGSGKTTLIRSMIRSFSVPEESITSPTFSYLHSYPVKDFTIHHFDLYRLRKKEDIYSLGFADFEERDVILMEWPEIVLPILEKNILLFSLKIVGENQRQIQWAQN